MNILMRGKLNQLFSDWVDVAQATMVRRVLREIQVHLAMDIKDHKVSLVPLACQDHVDREGLSAPPETLGWMPVEGEKVHHWYHLELLI